MKDFFDISLIMKGRRNKFLRIIKMKRQSQKKLSNNINSISLNQDYLSLDNHTIPLLVFLFFLMIFIAFVTTVIVYNSSFLLSYV